MIRQVEKLLDEQIRPGLAGHGGNIELVDIDNNIIYIRLSGGCQGCMASKITLTQGIERIIKANFPDIEKVIDLTNHSEGENPYYSDKGGKSPF